jgi:hypothetical protein
MRHLRTRKSWITPALLLAVWIVCIAAGLRMVWQYSYTPAPLAKPPGVWPAAAALTRNHGRAALLLFVHPECPCSRATIGELDRILASVQSRVDVSVLFAIPTGAPAGWSDTDIIRSARRIPGVTVLQDPEGAIARRFGARTSGQALLYDEEGQLVFNGGITASRGHSGDNSGRDAIVSLVLRRSAALHRTPVFGCALFSER